MSGPVAQRLRSMDVDDAEAYGLIHELGHMECVRAEASVARFLNSHDSELRRIALNVLVNHWDLHKYAAACKQLLTSDVHEDVRDMAASCLGTIYESSKDIEALQLLSQRLSDNDEHWVVRQAAYDAILRILGYPVKDRPSMTKIMDFEQDVNWSLIERIRTGTI